MVILQVSCRNFEDKEGERGRRRREEEEEEGGRRKESPLPLNP
jgi:hypothetical protein